LQDFNVLKGDIDDKGPPKELPLLPFHGAGSRRALREGAIF
jgi:hypothetical protein